jgi:hypothetical protein
LSGEAASAAASARTMPGVMVSNTMAVSGVKVPGTSRWLRMTRRRLPINVVRDLGASARHDYSTIRS